MSTYIHVYMQKRMPRSFKKFIRRQKAAIRRQFLDIKKQEELITELYNKTSSRATKIINTTKEVKQVIVAKKKVGNTNIKNKKSKLNPKSKAQMSNQIQSPKLK